MSVALLSSAMLLSVLITWFPAHTTAIEAQVQSPPAATSTSTSTSTANSNPIEHLIILMMENRSFDHYLGWLATDAPNSTVNGLHGHEYNCVNPTDTVDTPGSECVYVGRQGYDVGPDDPGHDYDETRDEIYGYHQEMNNLSAPPRMDGFVWNAREMRHNLSNVMEMFTMAADSAPVLNALGLQYAIFDNWFCSVPGPTDPNRAFSMSGTSNGMVDNYNGTQWSQQSYFAFLGARNVSWSAYWDASLWALGYFADLTRAPNAAHVFPIADFYQDLKKPELPSFVWLQPSLTSTEKYGPPNWQHPDASVALGEQLIQSVYEALRDSVHWNTSALMITYDEHGGFYDHVSPPQSGVPPPDGVVAPNGFTFDRLGVRIPGVLVSPWIDAGTVITEPISDDGGQWESTSNLGTASKLFGVTDHISAREAWAATYESLFLKRDTPRDASDAPVFAPIKGWTMDELNVQRAKPLNEHLAIEVRFYCTEVLGKPANKCPVFANQGQASDYILALVPKYVDKIKNR